MPISECAPRDESRELGAEEALSEGSLSLSCSVALLTVVSLSFSFFLQMIPGQGMRFSFSKAVYYDQFESEEMFEATVEESRAIKAHLWSNEGNMLKSVDRRREDQPTLFEPTLLVALDAHPSVKRFVLDCKRESSSSTKCVAASKPGPQQDRSPEDLPKAQAVEREAAEVKEREDPTLHQTLAPGIVNYLPLANSFHLLD